jgi:hypothetical protein
MVRRRTCPGVDGRKQRFSRFSARRLSQNEPEEDSSSKNKDQANSDDETSLDTSGDEVEEAPPPLARSSYPKKSKRAVEKEESEQPTSKKSRRVSPSGKSTEDEKVEKVQVDTSIVASSPTSVFESHESLAAIGDDFSVKNKKNERLEMIEQSMIVSDVAMKLEEYARKAMRGRGASRARRGGAGVVTPPSQQHSISSRGLITYDDEYEEAGPGVVTDGDDSTTGEDSSFSGVDSAKEAFLVPPVQEMTTVNAITERMLSCSNYCPPHGPLVAVAAVAGFCMATPPNEDADLCNKILHLISACDKLAVEFRLYRAALHPLHCSGVTSPLNFGQNPRMSRVVSLEQIWEGAANRIDAVRDFKTFAVNCINKVLGVNGGYSVIVPFSKMEKSELQRTSDVWLRSVGSSPC